MQSAFVRHFNSGVVLVIALASGAWAQESAQSLAGAQGPISTKSMEVSAIFGVSGVQGVDTHRHPNFGGAFGYNFSPKWTILGEYTYMPLGTLNVSNVSGATNENENMQIFGGGLRRNFTELHKVLPKYVVPYAFAGVGYVRSHFGDSFSPAVNGVSNSSQNGNGYNWDAGVGAGIFLGKNWGVRPEIRWDRKDLFEPGYEASQNYFNVSGQIFYRFGGRRKK